MIIVRCVRNDSDVNACKDNKRRAEYIFDLPNIASCSPVMLPGTVDREHECCPGMLKHWATAIISTYHVTRVGPITIAYLNNNVS